MQRTPHSLYKVVSCLLEFKKLIKENKGKRLRGIGELAKRYETSERTLKRWARHYARDMELFSKNETQLLHKLAMKEEKLERLAIKFKRLRQSKPSASSEGLYKERMDLLQEELKMYRDLYNDARVRLDQSTRANNVNRTLLHRVRRELGTLKVQIRRMVPHIEDTSLDVYGEDHKSL